MTPDLVLLNLLLTFFNDWFHFNENVTLDFLFSLIAIIFVFSMSSTMFNPLSQSTLLLNFISTKSSLSIFLLKLVRFCYRL